MKESQTQIKKQIINFFYENEGNYISGENISNILGFSRVSTWKYIQKLREDGYQIDAVPNLGYKLRSAPDKLHGYALSRGLRTNTIGQKAIFYYDSIGSTNDRAYELAEEGMPEGTLVIAEKQLYGKGRMGRKWISPENVGIYISIILRPNMEIDKIPAVTLIAAMTVIKAMKMACGVDAGMKWPNDILINNKKVCGILTEIKAQPDMVDFLVLGIGVNVNASSCVLPPEGTSLSVENSGHVDRGELLKIMMEELETGYRQFEKQGFDPLREECKSVSSVIGKRVKIGEHHRSIEGQAVDIDEKGALIVREDNGELKQIFSGDVVLCRGTDVRTGL